MMNEIEVWSRLADCESGEWDANANPIVGSRRWDLAPFDDRTDHAYIFEGGLQFHPDTWDWLRPDDYPGSAHLASPIEQVLVAQEVLEIQGWKAWPVCSRKLGYR